MTLKEYTLTVFSDSHGNYRALEACLPVINAGDYFVYLGDGNRDVEKVLDRITAEVVRVAGNCDIGCDAPAETVLRVGETDFLLTHGHAYGVKSSLLRLALRAQELHCAYGLYGHTHRAGTTEYADVTLMNPGSAQKRGTYAVIRGDGKTFRCEIRKLCDGSNAK